MRQPFLLLSTVLALGLSGCSGEAEIDVDASPDVTATDTLSDGTTATETSTETVTATETETVTAEPTQPQATSSPDDGDVAALAFTDCEAERYTIGYPQDWNVNEPDDLTDECRIFHPGEIETADQPRDRDLHWAASVYIDAVEYEGVRDADGPDEEIDRRELTVDGRDAFVRETRSSGEALMPEGERRYAYTVDLDGEILVVVTYSIGETDYERDKAIIDRMVTEELSISG
ncbi:MAG: hypothetical protein KY457_08640 [Actinobacteria bacterium]|nr:hypothetical protein [Actinomycetota bacterium]